MVSFRTKRANRSQPRNPGDIFTHPLTPVDSPDCYERFLGITDYLPTDRLANKGIHSFLGKNDSICGPITHVALSVVWRTHFFFVFLPYGLSVATFFDEISVRF